MVILRFPKVLVACPTSDRHDYIIKEYLDNVNNFTYPKCRHDLMLIDTTLDNGKHFKKLKKMTKNMKIKVKVLRHKYNPKKRHPLQMLADARELMRQEVLNNGYGYMFNLDSDILPPKNAVEQLIHNSKDMKSFLVHVYHKPFPQRPCVFHSGNIILGKGLDYFTWKEVRELPKLSKVYASGFGCMMIKRKVLEAVPFRTHNTFLMGEDLWFYNEAYDKGFECWLLNKRVKHANCEWTNVLQKAKSPSSQFWIAQGWDNGTKPIVSIVNKYVKTRKRSVK